MTLTLAIAGCGSVGGVSAPTPGDASGEHLLVYSSDRQAAGQFDIYLYDLDVLGYHNLPGLNSATASELHPAITVDGRIIAFQRTAGPSSDVLIYDRATNGFVTPPGLNTPAAETEPAFSGDGLKLAFTRDTLGATRIRLYDGVGDTLVRLPGLDTLATFSDRSPAPDATGARIAFVSDRNGTQDVLVWDRALGLLDIPELASDSTDADPSISGDGLFLCFASTRAGGLGGYDLYLYDFTAHTLTPLTINTTANERHPSLSVHGDIISFESDRPGGLGKIDVWNYSITSGHVGQGVQMSSPADDIQPAIRWR